jgi:hypothetical protein
MVFFMWFEGLETERSRRIPLLILHMILLASVYNFLFSFFFLQQVISKPLDLRAHQACFCKAMQQCNLIH